VTSLFTPDQAEERRWEVEERSKCITNLFFCQVDMSSLSVNDCKAKGDYIAFLFLFFHAVSANIL
jgi:hypothetical protein